MTLDAESEVVNFSLPQHLNFTGQIQHVSSFPSYNKCTSQIKIDQGTNHIYHRSCRNFDTLNLQKKIQNLSCD